MRILVCGHRDFDDWDLLSQTLENIYLHDENVKVLDTEIKFAIIEGGANGADFLAKVWAKFRMLDYEEYPADWKKYGKKAGSIRNQQMLDEGKPDLVVAFVDHSRDWSGTHDMIQKAKKAGVEVKEIDIR